MNPVCFVIQPFDGGKFDKRYDDIYQHAIRDAGYEGYRVDRDPSVNVPIERIEEGIRTSATCFVDVSENNPNVWFELGMAIAYRKPLCLVCSVERGTKYPFDVQHLSIISYKSDSSSDFSELKSKITERLTALTNLRGELDEIKTLTTTNSPEEIDSFEAACLAICVSESTGLGSVVSHWIIRNAMENAGYTSIATQIALRRLLRRQFMSAVEMHDDNNEQYDAYGIADKGWNWIERNLQKFELKKAASSSRQKNPISQRNLDDDDPF